MHLSPSTPSPFRILGRKPTAQTITLPTLSLNTAPQPHFFSFGLKEPSILILRNFYICAPGSLALLIHPHTLNFFSVLPTPLPETVRTGHNGHCRRVNGLTVNSDKWGRTGLCHPLDLSSGAALGGVGVGPLGRGFIGPSLALNACARRHNRSLLCIHPAKPACMRRCAPPRCADPACMRRCVPP